MHNHTETQKITANLPKATLKAAQEYTGLGITETLKIALEDLKRKKAYQDLLALRGKVKFGLTWQEMKEDR